MVANQKEWFDMCNQRNKNFKEVVLPLKNKEATDEANRCLFCYDAPCVKACPTEIDIPLFIKKIASNNLYGSAKTIMEANPVGASCARVCPTSELCEGACVLNDASKPILIGLLQRHATDWAIKNNTTFFEKGEKNGRKVAIVGGGPAGLSAARELARLGYEVTIYEAKEKLGGLSTYGIVPFRLPEEISVWEGEQVRQLGVKITCNTRVGKDINPNELLQNYDSVLLAVGMSMVPDLEIEGEKLEGVLDAISFIEHTKTKETIYDMANKKVVVIGAGNTAIDAATCAKRLGASYVKVLYRRTEKEMTAYPFEYEFAKSDGIEFKWLVSPNQIMGENGKVSGIKLLKMQLDDSDKNERRKPNPIKNSEYIIETDYVIKAIGQKKHQSLISRFQLQHHHGIVTIEKATYKTSRPNIFAAGDVVFGDSDREAMVVDAAQQGKEAAYSIHAHLANK